MMLAAEGMDAERVHFGQSAAWYVSHLKKYNPVVKKRKRGDSNDALYSFVG